VRPAAAQAAPPGPTDEFADAEGGRPVSQRDVPTRGRPAPAAAATAAGPAPGPDRDVETPEPDAVEQSQAADGDEEPALDAEFTGDLPLNASEADVVEQRRIVETEEDEYR
jgi:hypothetical protein